MTRERGPPIAGDQHAQVGKALIYVIHDLAQRGLDPAARGISAVISAIRIDRQSMFGMASCT